MISEFVIAAGLLGTYRGIESYYNKNKWKTKEIKGDINTFNDLCKSNETDFYLLDGSITPYGTKFIISLKGKTFDEIDKLKDKLEIEFKCDIELEQNDNKCTATLDIFKHSIDDNYKFEPMKTKPYELYFGIDNRFKPITADMFLSPNVLVGGSTGKGKTEEIKIILTNLLNNYTARDIAVNFINLSGTNDFRSFLNCKQTKSYIEDIDESIKLLDNIIEEYNKRLTIFKTHNVGNIKEYNAKNYNKRMNYTYIVIDEFTDLMPTTKLDPLYDNKVIFYDKLGHIIRKARKTGCFVIAGLQRSDTDSMKATLKANFNVRIGFGLPNNASSLVICDSNDCVDLPNRKFLFCNNGSRLWSKSLYISPEIIDKYLLPSIIPNRQSQPDFNSFLKSKKQKEETTQDESATKETKGKAKAKAKKKSKVADQEIATTETKEPTTRVKNVSCESIDTYEIVNSTICTKTKRKVD